jgi:hypothetical protein
VPHVGHVRRPNRPRPGSNRFAIPTPLSLPQSITAGPDGALWFTESNANKIGRLAAIPASKNECKNSGWKNFPGFKNQGQCVSYVATGGKNPPATKSG